MQPIPLPPIVEIDNGFPLSLTMLFLGIGLLLLGVAGVFLSIKLGLGPLTEIGAILIIIAFVPGLLGGLTYFAPPPGSSLPSYAELLRQEADHDRLVQRAVEREYGLKLTEGQANALAYPEKAPKSDFKIYGSFKDRKQTEGTDFGFESRTIYLVWSKDRLGLAESTDGESFTPITSKQEAK